MSAGVKFDLTSAVWCGRINHHQTNERRLRVASCFAVGHFLNKNGNFVQFTNLEEGAPQKGGA